MQGHPHTCHAFFRCSKFALTLSASCVTNVWSMAPFRDGVVCVNHPKSGHAATPASPAANFSMAEGLQKLHTAWRCAILPGIRSLRSGGSRFVCAFWRALSELEQTYQQKQQLEPLYQLRNQMAADFWGGNWELKKFDQFGPQTVPT